jgi:hypothetical protein
MRCYTVNEVGLTPLDRFSVYRNAHGSFLDQSGINAVQPGETLEVRVGPGHKGPHVTEVLSVASRKAAPAMPQ